MNFVRPVRSGRSREPETEPRLEERPDPAVTAETRALQTLAERVLADPPGLPGSEFTIVQLLVGALPRLPFALPLPPGATVIGSVLRTLPVPSPTPELADTVEVVLDVEDMGYDVGAFYDTALSALGWSATLSIVRTTGATTSLYSPSAPRNGVPDGDGALPAT